MKRMLAKLIPISLVNFKLKYYPGDVDFITWTRALASQGYNISFKVADKEK